MSENSTPADQKKITKETTHLIFLPGLHGTDDLYDHLLEHLESEVSFQRTLINYPDDINQSYGKLTAWLSAHLFLDEINPTSVHHKTVIIAESFSTVIALQLAEKFPEKIDGVIISGGFCSSPVPTIFSYIPLRPFFFIKPPLTIIRRYLTGSTCPLDLVKDVRSVMKKVSTKRITQRLRSIFALEEESVPSISSTPIMLLQAEHDEVISWEKQNQLEQHLPHAEAHWLDAPHLIFQVQPSDSATLILEFLEKIK